MRKALVVGINHYEDIKSLNGCVNDAMEVNRVLSRHANNEDHEKNFEVELITADHGLQLSRGILKDRIEEFFRDPREISLLYFSEHGHVEFTGGYLMTSECKRGDDGLSMAEILSIVNNSPAHNNIIIFDCCHAGSFGKSSMNTNLTSINEGVTVLAASAANQYSVEKNGSGVFTRLLIHALDGGAASILGEVTPGNIYGYIDKAMGEKGQRPIFMTSIRRYTNLRKVYTQIRPLHLKEMIKLFPNSPDEIFNLNPSFEPKSDKPNPENIKKFEVLQKYNRVNLVVPVDAPHMYDAAMESKSCKLTTQGKSYWEMVNNDII
ncbi:MAG: caspase family protein [Flavobacteriaceae bacterium]|nr:MAG: caspase family protein [Flavobacteriaceae bacterium]